MAETVNDAGKLAVKNAANSVYNSFKFAVPVAISPVPVAAVYGIPFNTTVNVSPKFVTAPKPT